MEVQGIISRFTNKAVLSLFIWLAIITVLIIPALAQSEITPDSVVYVSQDNALTAGKPYNVTVQIQFAGGALKSEGVRVYFISNNTSIIPAELGTFVLTDKYGIATYQISPIRPGNVKLTAMASSTTSGVSADKNYRIVEGAVPTATATAAPTLTPTPTPTAAINATATPTAKPTSTATPTIAPTATASPPTPTAAANMNAQAFGIITVGIVTAVILIVVVLLVQAYKKK